MGGKDGARVWLTAGLIVLVVGLVIAFAFSYSSMSTEIRTKGQEIAQLDNKILSQNTTISSQNSDISKIKSNETNMSLMITDLQAALISAGGNYNETHELLNFVDQVYGIHTYVVAYNTSLTVAPHQIYCVQPPFYNPSRNTTFVTICPSQIMQVGGSNNSTYYNLTFLVNNPGEYGFEWETAPIIEPYYGIYVDNVGNVPETFNFTILEMWR